MWLRMWFLLPSTGLESISQYIVFKVFLMMQKKGVGISKLLSAGAWVPQVLVLFEICSLPEKGDGRGEE